MFSTAATIDDWKKLAAEFLGSTEFQEKGSYTASKTQTALLDFPASLAASQAARQTTMTTSTATNNQKLQETTTKQSASKITSLMSRFMKSPKDAQRRSLDLLNSTYEKLETLYTYFSKHPNEVQTEGLTTFGDLLSKAKDLRDEELRQWQSLTPEDISKSDAQKSN